MEKSYFSLFSYTDYCFPNRFDDMNKMYADLENIKDTKLYSYSKELIEALLPRAIGLSDREKEIERIGIYLGRRNELQRALQTFKSDENRKAFDDFIYSLENWKEAHIDYLDKTLVINGNNQGKSAYCGVKIGRGNKIHIMKVSINFNEKEDEYFIGADNDTQWRNSDLVIIDVIENIPSEIKAYFNQDKRLLVK